MATTNLGKVSLTPKGEYDPEARYEALDVVQYAGSGFVALRTVQGVKPVDGEDYMLIAARGSSQEFTSTLLGSGWTGDGPYRQTITLSGLEDTFGNSGHGILSVAPNANDAAWNAAALGRIQVESQVGDTLTVTAARGCPTVDIPVTILIVG